MTESALGRLLVYLIVVIAVWGAYRYRVHFESWWWHLRHGEVIAIADYIVPAPTNWYVKDATNDGGMMIRLDTDDRAVDGTPDKNPRWPAAITLSTRSSVFTIEKIDAWTSLQESVVKKSGVEPAFRRFNFDGETLSCVGGQKFSQALKGPRFHENNPSVWSCESSGRLGLLIMATDADMPQVWDIVSGIHKRP